MNTTTLTAGDPAPDFSGIAVGGEFAEGKPFRLSDYFHEQIVLYFYPQDHTPGCTTQACKLRDAWAEFGSRANLFGVSIGSPDSPPRVVAPLQPCAESRGPFGAISVAARYSVSNPCDL